MTTDMTVLKNRLYADGGLGTANIKVSPGCDRDVSAEQVAREVNRSLYQLEAGQGEALNPDKE